MTDRLELLNDLRSEQAVRQHAVVELEKGQIPLDTAVAGLSTFLEVGEGDLPSVDVLAVSLTAEVLMTGESEPRKVTFKLPVPVRPEPPPVVGGGVANVRVLGEHVMPVGLPASTTAAWQDVIRTLMSSNQLSRIQLVSAAGAALSGGGAFATVVDGTSNTDAPQDVETSLLELFEDSPDEWYTIADLTHELQSQGFVVEHGKVRRAVQNLADQHSELRKVTRKSWSWEPVEAQDDDHDVEPDDETPEAYMAGKSDAPDYVDSDGLTTSDIPLEADGD